MVAEGTDSEVEARRALASSPDGLARTQRWGNVGVWEVDLRSGEVYWSTPVFRMLGLDSCGLDEFRSVVHPDDVAVIDHLLARVLAQPGPYQVTHRILRGGEVRTVDQFVQSVAGPDGTPVRLIGTIVDTTDTHRLRDQVRHAEQARLIGVIAGGLAHDFNNLLTIVDGHTSVLLDQVDDETIRPALEAIKRAAIQASATTRKLMSLGRSDATGVGPLAVAPLLDEVVGWARPAAPAVEITASADATHLSVLADSNQLRRVLLDLIINARDADATTVRLTARLSAPTPEEGVVPAGAMASNRYVTIAVTDDGVGMSAATRARAVEPFFSTKPPAVGSGLGLANAAAHVAQMHGFLDIDSHPGEGTTVTIALPDPSPAPEPALRTGRRQPTRIVVAADSATSTDIADLLAAIGHQVVVAADVRTLTYCLRSEPIDAAIIDMRMEPPEGWPPEVAAHPTVWVDGDIASHDIEAFRSRVASALAPR